MGCCERRDIKSRQNPELSVVIPVYQERDVIAETIEELTDVLAQLNLLYEIVVVDDGSTDGTHEVLKELSVRFPGQLRIITHPYNKGNGAAVKIGISEARGESIVCMDADGQHDPHELQQMLPYLGDYDLVIGARSKDYKGAWHRKLANKLYNGLASWLAQFPIEDLTSGYRVFKASIVRKYVHLFPARFSYPATSTLAFIKGGHNVKFVPITTRLRQGNVSKIRLIRDGWLFLLIIIKSIVIFEPLRVFLPISLILFLLGILYTIYNILLIGRLYMPNTSVLLFVVSVLVALLGLIAEQIAAIRVLTRNGKE